MSVRKRWKFSSDTSGRRENNMPKSSACPPAMWCGTVLVTVFCFLFFCLLWAPPALAHHAAIGTDRPDAAEASTVVGKHHLQVETSFGFSQDREGRTTTRIYSFPTLFRFGIFDPLELRLEGEMFAWRMQTGSNTENGFNDIAVGAKAHFFENEGLRPSLGGLFHLNVPTGRASFSANVAEPIMKVLADWELPADFSLGVNTGVDIPARDENGNKHARFLYAVSVGHAIPFWPEKLRAFLETSGIVPMQAHIPDENTLDTGLTFALTKTIQLDSFVQIGLSDAAPDFATGLGFSWLAL